MRDHLDQLGHPQVVIVSFAEPSMLARYREHLAVGFPLLTDVDRDLYRLLGAGRASMRRVWSLGTLRAYARLLARGRRLRRPTEDTRQLGADAVLDASGHLVSRWLPTGPDDRPGLDEIAEALTAPE